MSTSSSINVHDSYNIYVNASLRGWPDDKSLSCPRVSILWNVTRSYKSENPPIRKATFIDHNSEYKLEDEFRALSWINNDKIDDMLTSQSYGIISRMISRINFPFELARLIWRNRFDPINTTKQLKDVDHMISQIVQLVKDEVISGRKKVDLVVQVEKQYTIPHQEYEAKVEAREDDKLIDDYMLLCATLRRELDGRQQDLTFLQSRLGGFGTMKDGIVSQLSRNGRRMNNIERLSEIQDVGLSIEQALRESIEQAEHRPIPATSAAVEALDKFVLLDDKRGGASSSSMCLICREEMLSGVQVTQMPCSHIFHGDCLLKWLNHWGHTCPLCKWKLPTQ